MIFSSQTASGWQSQAPMSMPLPLSSDFFHHKWVAGTSEPPEPPAQTAVSPCGCCFPGPGSHLHEKSWDHRGWVHHLPLASHLHQATRILHPLIWLSSKSEISTCQGSLGAQTVTSSWWVRFMVGCVHPVLHLLPVHKNGITASARGGRVLRCVSRNETNKKRKQKSTRTVHGSTTALIYWMSRQLENEDSNMFSCTA